MDLDDDELWFTKYKRNYVSKDKIKEIFSNKRNKIIFIRNRNERLYKVKILDEIEKELLGENNE
jgi:hypothetical protein